MDLSRMTRLRPILLMESIAAALHGGTRDPSHPSLPNLHLVLGTTHQAHVSMTADEADDAAQIGSPNSAAVVAGVACASGTRFRCVARVKQQGKPSVDEMVGSSTPDISPPISFEFELEVHSASKWAGDAARNACVEVSGSFEEGGNRGAFHRLWDNLRHDVLRQNRHWRREMKRAAQGAGGA